MSDQPISQSERVARIRAEAAQEAQEREDRLWGAEIRTAMPSKSESRARSHGGNFAAEAERVLKRRLNEEGLEERRALRDPCTFCGVRADHHEQFGCKRWRLMR
jgi:hypothetical protein